MSKPLFGRQGKIIEGHMNAWCMFKIIRLVGSFEEPTVIDMIPEWRLAHSLEKSEYEHPKTGLMEKYIKVKSLREELEQLPRELCSEECIDFIESLLILDHTKRPKASEALRHPFVEMISV